MTSQPEPSGATPMQRQSAPAPSKRLDSAALLVRWRMTQMRALVAATAIAAVCATVAQSMAQSPPARPDAQGALSPAEETPPNLAPIRRHDDFPLPPLLPDGPFADVGGELFNACNGNDIYQFDKGGVVMCMGENLNARCGDNLECRYSVHRWIRAVLKV
jgi:hypothetical protein